MTVLIMSIVSTVSNEPPKVGKRLIRESQKPEAAIIAFANSSRKGAYANFFLFSVIQGASDPALDSTSIFGDQVDTAVVPDVRGQRRAAPASCARLQSWQLSPHACNTGADQGLVTDKLEGEADQDRRESREPRTLCRLPNGGGRHPTTNVPGDSAADRGTTAAATTRASMKRSIVTRSSAIDRRNASRCQ